MRGYRQTLLVLLLTIFSGVTVAQNNTNSPYTRYGFGQLADQGSGNSRAMGGVAYGLRDKFQINSANPASYTAVDSLTFIFDGGLGLQNVNFSDGTLKQNVKNSSFDYISMQFRVAPWAGVSLGLLPYSNVGYNLYETVENEESDNEYATVNTFSGEGGLHQLYLGAGFKILKNLSVGVNFSYLWGDITRTVTQSFPNNSSAIPVVREQGTSVSSYKIDLGVQYTHQFSKKHSATLGVVFSPGHALGNDSYVQETTSTVNHRDTVADFDIPTTLGMGVAYNYDNRLTVGVDATVQNWADATYMNNSDAFCNRMKLSAGAEFIPNPMGRNYLAHVKYRLGAYYHRPYYKIAGSEAAKEYGVTAGFGLPIPRTRSVLSLSFQYGKTKGQTAAFLDENLMRISIGMTFNERWFYKFKVK